MNPPLIFFSRMRYVREWRRGNTWLSMDSGKDDRRFGDNDFNVLYQHMMKTDTRSIDEFERIVDTLSGTVVAGFHFNRETGRLSVKILRMDMLPKP